MAENKRYVPAVSMNADAAAQSMIRQNVYSKFNAKQISRVPAAKMMVPPPKVQNNFQMAVQKKQDQAKVAVGAGVLATALSFFNPAPAMAADLAAGQQIFDGNCSACHAGGQNVIQAEKTLQKDALVEYLAGGFKEASIRTQVTNGKNAMPAFGGKLSDDDIANVAAYVYDQANGNKWDEAWFQNRWLYRAGM